MAWRTGVPSSTVNLRVLLGGMRELDFLRLPREKDANYLTIGRKNAFGRLGCVAMSAAFGGGFVVYVVRCCRRDADKHSYVPVNPRGSHRDRHSCTDLIRRDIHDHTITSQAPTTQGAPQETN